MSLKLHVVPSEPLVETGLSDVIKVAVLAVGGQGGGVLTNWIADLASKGGYDVQMTSVAGVAQRTGATVYYIEMAPRGDRPPVFAQSPSPGDVDIMIAAELMEAGRAVLRGFVTPDRTTLVASSHRILAVSEKQVPGDGRSDAELMRKRITDAARKTLCFDMERIATQAGSVISASLFGALAKSEALPFPVALYEQVIRASGRGVEQSLAAFRASVDFDESTELVPSPESHPKTRLQGPDHLLMRWRDLMTRVDSIDVTSRALVELGLRKVVDYQDVDYGFEYLDKVLALQAIDDATHGHELTKAAAKYIANAMCYDDIVRVADLKIRASRDQRVRGEQQVNDSAIVRVTEYFHPRAEEITATMPASIGAWFRRSPRAFKACDLLVNRGRRLRTDRLGGFLTLWLIASVKPYRRKLLRHQTETAHIDNLIEQARGARSTDYALAVEILKNQRLVKGYSDTHARGHSKFDRIMCTLETLKGRQDAAQWMCKLRELALKDESGSEMDMTIKSLQS